MTRIHSMWAPWTLAAGISVFAATGCGQDEPEAVPVPVPVPTTEQPATGAAPPPGQARMEEPAAGAGQAQPATGSGAARGAPNQQVQTAQAAQTQGTQAAQKGGFPPPEGKALWQYLQAQNFQKWPLWPGTERYYPSSSAAHGALLTIYVNPVALEAIKAKTTGALPVHSIVVKENYGKDKQLMAHTVMYKVQGYNPKGGDWFWLRANSQGNVVEAGQIDSCQTCHAKAKTGYTFTHGQQ